MMKKITKIILLLLISTPICVIAQKVGNFNLGSFYGSDSSKIYASIDSLILGLQKGYKLKEVTPWDAIMTANFSDRVYENDSLKITVEIYMNKTAGNPSLDIDGKPYYSIVHIKGKYIDIFPIWKKINPIANLETATSNTDEGMVSGWKFLGKNGVGSWIEIKSALAQKRNIYSIDFTLLNWVDYKMSKLK